jgi:hypothetical protein
LNLFRVQTFLENFGKFSKILTCLSLQEYKFRSPYLCVKF